MAKKKDSTSKKELNPNLASYRIEFVQEPADVLESALIETIKLHISELHLGFKRDPHSLPGSLEYLLYWDVGREEPDYIGKIGLSKIGRDVTQVLLESVSGVQWINVFEQVILLWKDRYERTYPSIIKYLIESKASATPAQVNFKGKIAWDDTLIRMWNDGYSNREISNRVHVSPERITNRISEIRRFLGVDGRKLLPYDEERKKRLIEATNKKS